MDRIAVIGGGIAGCSAAYRLSEAGKSVVLVEKSGVMGGNIRNFGCKADEKCVRDNLCLVEGVFDKVKNNINIEIIYDSEVIGLTGKPGEYSLGIRTAGLGSGNGCAPFIRTITDIRSIILATGYVKSSEKETRSIQWAKDENIIWASHLEELLYKRGSVASNAGVPGYSGISLKGDIKRAVFIQCNGSRSIQEKADYCSRVCCGYSYRMARALKYFYKDIEINMLYMDLQEAGYAQELSFEELDSRGIGYILCKPVDISRRDGCLEITCEDRENGGIKTIAADLVVLSEGIHPGADNERLATVFNLQEDDRGFLYNIEDEMASGIYLAGTVKGPKPLSESINDARVAVDRVLRVSAEEGSHV